MAALDLDGPLTSSSSARQAPLDPRPEAASDLLHDDADGQQPLLELGAAGPLDPRPEQHLICCTMMQTDSSPSSSLARQAPWILVSMRGLTRRRRQVCGQPPSRGGAPLHCRVAAALHWPPWGARDDGLRGQVRSRTCTCPLQSSAHLQGGTGDAGKKVAERGGPDSCPSWPPRCQRPHLSLCDDDVPGCYRLLRAGSWATCSERRGGRRRSERPAQPRLRVRCGVHLHRGWQLDSLRAPG